MNGKFESFLPNSALEMEREERKRFVLEARRLADEINPRIRGEIAGLALGLKPAVLVGQDSTAHEQLAELFRAQGRNTVIIGEVLVDIDAALARAEAEPDLADEIGWSGRVSAAENIAHASASSRDAAPERHALMGFLLGYPATVIRDFVKRIDRPVGGRLEKGKRIQIMDPFGDPVFTFKIFKQGNADAPEVQELRERVRRAFAETGFALQEQSPL